MSVVTQTMNSPNPNLSPYIVARMKEQGVRVSTLRNGGIGFIIGSCFLALKWNKMRRNEQDWQTFKNQWYSYLMKFPIFISSFTIMYKGLSKIGRQVAGYRGLTESGRRKVGRKLILSFSAFLCGYTSQMIAPVFNWNWALYAFLRSMLGICRLEIPIDLQPSSTDLYALIHGVLPYFICYNCKYISKSYYGFFKAVLNEKRETWIRYYQHHHGILPPCKDCVHRHSDSCLKTFIFDGIEQYKICFIFYLKFYLITSLLGGLTFLRRLLKTPNIVIPNLLKQTLLSSLFLFISFHFPSRIHCFYQWYLNKYHKNIKKNKYTPIAANNLWIMLSISALFGTYCIRLERSKSKRTDIALFSFWRILEIIIRIKTKLDTYDKEDEHPILGSNQLPAILFGLSCGMAVYVHISDPKALKSLEKNILKYALA